jgi:hypothetical protein
MGVLARTEDRLTNHGCSPIDSDLPEHPTVPLGGLVVDICLGVAHLIRDSDVVASEESARDVAVSGWWRFQQLRSGTREQRKQLALGEPADAGRHGMPCLSRFKRVASARWSWLR